MNGDEPTVAVGSEFEEDPPRPQDMSESTLTAPSALVQIDPVIPETPTVAPVEEPVDEPKLCWNVEHQRWM